MDVNRPNFLYSIDSDRYIGMNFLTWQLQICFECPEIILNMPDEALFMTAQELRSFIINDVGHDMTKSVEGLFVSKIELRI